MPRYPKAISNVPTPYAVICPGDAWGAEHACGKTFLTEKAYNHAMTQGAVRWKCPVCGGNADFDDNNLENFHKPKKVLAI